MPIDAAPSIATRSSPTHPAPYPASLAPAKLAPGVLAKVGETFSVALSALQRSLAAIGPLDAGQQAVLDAGLAEIDRLEQLGLQLQEIARVLAGDALLTPEHVDLAKAARDVIAEWSQQAQMQGARLAEPREPFAFDVNAAVLWQLLDLGIAYALRLGSDIGIQGSIEGRPAHPALMIRVQRPASARSPAFEAKADDLHWLMFVQLAHAVGLAPHRIAAEQAVTLMLGFPERDAEANAADAVVNAATRTAPAAGHRVLLVEPNELSRGHAFQLMHEAGMQVDTAVTLEQARDTLRNGSPDVIVTGLPVDDERCCGLLDEVRIAQPRLRVIQLVDDDNAFAFSVPGTDHPARIGRNNMDQTLIRAVAQELDAAWSGS